jgi:hypothetical protein
LGGINNNALVLLMVVVMVVVVGWWLFLFAVVNHPLSLYPRDALLW